MSVAVSLVLAATTAVLSPEIPYEDISPMEMAARIEGCGISNVDILYTLEL